MTLTSTLWQKAHKAAEEARFLSVTEQSGGVVFGAYDATFKAARTLIAERVGIEAGEVRRHAAVLRLFSDHFVRTGLVDADFGRAIRRLFDRRANAAYSNVVVLMDEVSDTLAVMDRFLDLAASLRRGH